MNNNVKLIFIVLISYFIGNINWAIIISKHKNTDIRKMGSGNPGTLNVSRNFGIKLGLLTFFLDVLKGAIPTLLAFFIIDKVCVPNSNFKYFDVAIYIAGLSAILGHIYPVIFKFKGGKGIATTIGVFIVCESIHGVWALIPFMALVAAGTFIYLTEFGAMGSFIAITPPAISGSIRLLIEYSGFTDFNTKLLMFISNFLILLICFFTWFAHRKNIERMLSGDEHLTSIKSIIIKAKAKKVKNTFEDNDADKN